MVSDDRAQLVLIGAVLAALVILGLTTVINTVLFTEDITTSVGGSGSVAADEYDYEVRSAASSVVLRLNHEGRNDSATDLAGWVRKNFSGYRQIRQELSVSGRDVLVDLSFNNGSTGTVYGRRIVQAGDANFTTDGGAADWTPVPGGDNALVGRLVMNVDVGDTSDTTPFVMRISETTSSQYVEYELSNDGGDGTGNLTVETDQSSLGLGTTTSKCRPAGGRVVIDFGQGNSYTGSCDIGSFRELDQPLQVRFRNGKQLVGKYDIALDRSTSRVGTDYGKCWQSPTPAIDQPCVAPIVWQANVSVAYETDNVQYSNEHNVTIYEVDS